MTMRRLIGPLLRGAALLVVVSASSVPAQAAGKVVCMTDDGYGRLAACRTSYKADHPNWRELGACYVDEGRVPFRPCTAEERRRH